MRQSDRERRMLARTQALMVVVSLIPLTVLFYISWQYVFSSLAEQGQDLAIYGISLTLGLTALVVVLGYILVRRDTMRTIEAIEEGERRLDQLYEGTGRLAALDDPVDLRCSLLEVAVELTGAERAGLWLRERDELQLSCALGMSQERGQGFPLPVGQGLVGMAAARATTLRDEQLTDTDRSWDDRVVTKTASSLVVPLELRAEVVAVLDLRNKAGAGEFSPIDQQMAEGLARQATQFLKNAAFHDSEAHFEEAVAELVKSVTERYLCWPGHVDNVLAIAEKLGAKLDLPIDKQRSLRLAALVHDIGLLDQPKVDIGPPGGPVDHSEAGSQRLAGMAFWADAAPIVRAHHEQMDGRGPLGLRGFAIPMTSRILALAEYVDSVTNPGSPWGTKSLQQVVDEISSEEDKRFDPTVVLAFVEDYMQASSSLDGMPVVPDAERGFDPEDPWA
jgi:HD-GYP domain-containing protein (c-di-GMP phosphodiesterase class II)